MKDVSPVLNELILCVYGSTLAGIIGSQFKAQSSTVFSIMFLISDGHLLVFSNRLNASLKGRLSLVVEFGHNKEHGKATRIFHLLFLRFSLL